MTDENNNGEGLPKNNLHAFIAANLTPVAQSLVKEEGMTLDVATVVARREIVSEWNFEAERQSDVLRTDRLAWILDGSLFGAGGVCAWKFSSDVGLIGSLGFASFGLFVGAFVLGKDIVKTATQIYQDRQIQRDDQGRSEVYDAAQQRVNKKYGLEMRPTLG